MAQIQQNQNEKKVNYSLNLGIVEEEAKNAFLELVDEIKSANEDNREAKLLASRKAKIFDYYLVYLKEIEKIKGYAFFTFIAVVIWLNFDKQIFKITDNYVFDTAVQGATLFLIGSFAIIALCSQNNIERFFLKLYPQLKTEAKVGLIAQTLRDFIFNDYQKKENGFRKILFFFVCLIAVDGIILYSGNYLNLNLVGLGFFIVFLMAHKKENNVLKNI